MKKQTKAAFINDNIEAINKRNEFIAKRRDALSPDQFESKEALEKKQSEENKRIKENNECLLAALKVESTANILYAHNIAPASFFADKYTDSREFKKRLLRTLKAIAQNNPELLKCDYAPLAELSKGKKNTLTNRAIHALMKHDKAAQQTTQANYFINFCVALGIAKKAKDGKSTVATFDTENALFKKLIALHH